MVTEVSRQSWGGRLMNSIRGVLFGLILFVGSFVLLWWNESRAVRDYQNINELRDKTVAVQPESIARAHDGQPVHVTGEAETPEVLEDPQFGVSQVAIRLRRTVEMYQWRENERSETRKKIGGGTETVTEYSYDREWAGDVINSSGFKQASGHENPSTMPYEDWQDTADQVTLGSYTLSPPLVRKLDFFETLIPRDPNLPAGAGVEGRHIYFGENPKSPEIGDVRISFQVVEPDTVSVVARQSGSELTPWRTANGTDYSRVQRGTHTLESMMDQAESEARMQTWILRGVGWLLMALGIGMVLKPLSVMGDVIPLLGNLIGGGIAVVAGLVSAVLTLATIAIAWIAVRPLIGVPLLVVAAALLFLQWKKSRADKAAVRAAETRPAPPPPPPPPPPGA